jgi:hypothetical protein
MFEEKAIGDPSTKTQEEPDPAPIVIDCGTFVTPEPPAAAENLEIDRFELEASFDFSDPQIPILLVKLPRRILDALVEKPRGYFPILHEEIVDVLRSLSNDPVAPPVDRIEALKLLQRKN